MSEKQIEKALILEVSKVGGWAIKLPAVYITGIPDRLVLHEGRAYFVELKATGEKPRKSQLLIHRKLAALGFRVRVIDSLDGVRDFISTITGGRAI